MSQSSFSIANISRALYRSAVNAALQALGSNNSGASEPTEKYAHMWWTDTASGWVKQRNAANSDWEKKFPIAKARVDVASAATLNMDDNAVTSDYVRITGTTTVTAVTLASGQRRIAVAGGAFQLTNSASLVVQGGANYTTSAGDVLLFFGESGGVVRVSIIRSGTSAIYTAQVANSGTAKTFAGIPDSHSCIDVTFDGLSLSGSDNFLIRIGDSGGLETSGYTSSSEYGGIAVSSTAGFIVRSAGAGDLHSGVMSLRRVDGNKWACSGVVRLGASGSSGGAFAGRKELTGALTQISVTRTGTNTFDGGTVNVISW